MHVLFPVGTSDHCVISCNLKFVIPLCTTFERTVWYYEKANFNEYRQVLNEHDWGHCFAHDNIDDICNTWTNDFLNVSKMTVPNRQATIRPNDKPYYTNTHRRTKRKLDRAHKKAKQTNAPGDWATFRTQRNQYISDLRSAETSYEKKVCDSLQASSNLSPKKWWHIAKSFLGIHPNYSLPPMEDENGKIYVNDKDKASAFNDFFMNQTKINASGKFLPEFTDKCDGNSLSDITTTPEEVYDILKSLKTNKATGPDGVSAKLLREAGASIAKPLSDIINLSLKTQQVPQAWKQAHVAPIHKNKERNKFINYRPISLLSCSGKVMERVVFKHVFNFFRDHNLLSKFQSGFTPGDSTVNQLVEIYHTFCDALDKKKDVRAVFCDISKAFDRVWHDGLILKLNQIGIKGNLLGWFKIYLENRK